MCSVSLPARPRWPCVGVLFVHPSVLMCVSVLLSAFISQCRSVLFFLFSFSFFVLNSDLCAIKSSQHCRVNPGRLFHHIPSHPHPTNRLSFVVNLWFICSVCVPRRFQCRCRPHGQHGHPGLAMRGRWELPTPGSFVPGPSNYVSGARILIFLSDLFMRLMLESLQLDSFPETLNSVDMLCSLLWLIRRGWLNEENQR